MSSWLLIFYYQCNRISPDKLYKKSEFLKIIVYYYIQILLCGEIYRNYCYFMDSLFMYLKEITEEPRAVNITVVTHT